MKIIRNFACFCLFATLSLIATSCNSNDPYDGGDWGNILTDIATFVSTSDNGSVFTVQEDGDSPAVTLTFINKLTNKDLIPGTRWLLAYIPESGVAYQSGPATLFGISYVLNGTLEEATAESTTNWRSMGQNVDAVWRTGKWLNINAQCDYVTRSPKQYSLVVDETTLEDPYPVVHLLYEADTSAQSETKRLFSSFDISSVWDLPNVKGITLNIVGLSGNLLYKFDKGTQTVQPVE